MSRAKVIIVTDAGRGLGKAMTLGFAGLGHTVIGCGRNATSMHEMQTQLGRPHSFSAVDTAVAQQVQRWAEKVLAQYGPPDYLINNAAIMNRLAPLWEQSEDEFSEIIDINIKGVANVIRSFLPSMLKRNSGVVVNLSSGWGRSTDAQVAPYCSTKYAIEGLTLALAQELPSGMTAVPLNPGIINTDMLQACFGISASHYPSPETWAEKAVPFILKLGRSDNGHSLTVPQ